MNKNKSYTGASHMKRRFILSARALFVSGVLLASTACSSTGGGNGAGSSKKGEPLNATNLNQLADENGYIYGLLFNNVNGVAIQFVDSNHVHLSMIDNADNAITIRQEDPVDYSDYLYEFSTMGESIFTFKKNAFREYTFHIQYADPDQQYIIMQTEDYGFNCLMKKNVLLSTYNHSISDFFSNREDAGNLQKLIEYMDMCKNN